MNAAPPVPPRRTAAAWFLGAVFVALFVFAWLRGAGRVVLPLLLVGAIATVIVRAVRAVMRPLP